MTYLMLDRSTIKRLLLLHRLSGTRWSELDVVLRHVTSCTLRIDGHQPAFLVALAKQDAQLFVFADGQLVRVLGGEVEEGHGGRVLTVGIRND